VPVDEVLQIIDAPTDPMIPALLAERAELQERAARGDQQAAGRLVSCDEQLRLRGVG
jgi:hypothetical protein